jgi:hypothetical protein
MPEIPRGAIFGPAARGFFVRGRVCTEIHRNFLRNGNFALLIVGYGCPFGTVRESLPSPDRLPL